MINTNFTKNSLALYFTFLSSVYAEQIVIDGVIDKTEWANAQVISEYKQSWPNTGEQPKYPTKTLIKSDEKGLYFAFENYQPERSRRYSGHDQYTSADFNMVFVDFNNDGDTAYEFVATLGGGTMDGTYSRGNQSNRDWDGLWQVQVSEKGDYWYSEFFIPWTTATFKQVEGGKRQVSIYLQRQNVIDNQAYSFPDTHRGRKAFTYEFAPVEVNNIDKQSIRSSAYVVEKYDFVAKKDETNLGLDLVWKPTGNQQFIATINPDFGQVESDELVINYSAVETLQTDKRPFFTENQSMFDVRGPQDLKLVHTRRIGSNAILDNNQVHDIDYAAKYILNSDLLNAGILIAQEGDAVGKDSKFFASGRWYKNFENHSLGQLVNWVDDPLDNRQSLVVNHDGQFQISPSSRLFANVIYSDVKSDNERKSGKGFTVAANYVPVRHWKSYLEWSLLDDKLDVNDFGYMQRNDLSKIKLSSQYDQYQFAPSSSLLNTRYYGELHSERNTQGQSLRDTIYVSAFARLKSQHKFRIGAKLTTSGYDDLISRGFGNVYLPSRKDFHLYYGSPTPADISLTAKYNYFQEGKNDWAESVYITYRQYLTDEFRLDVNYLYLDSDDWLIGNNDGAVNQYQRRLNKVYAKFVAKLNQRSDFTLTTQWFGLKAKAESIYQPAASASQVVNDFSRSQFALQARYRYHFTQGAKFYLVYSHNGIDTSLEKDSYDMLSDAIANPTQKSITAKFSWFF